MASDGGAEKQACLEHCWRYFELHSAQRINIFNYFVAFSGLATTGLAAVIQNGDKFAVLGIVMGVVIALVAIVFGKLDQRMSMLVKHAEKALIVAESVELSPHGHLFASEDASFDAASRQAIFPLRPQTMGASFRFLFIAMGCIGLAGSLVSALLAAGALSWSEHRERGGGMSIQIIQQPRPNDALASDDALVADSAKQVGTTPGALGDSNKTGTNGSTKPLTAASH